LESKVITAKIDNEEVIRIVRDGLNRKTLSKIKGQLFLQIIVNLKGESCLLSIKNETNVKTNKLNLKNTIDNNLKWEVPEKKVSAIFVLNFGQNRMEIKRLGMNSKIGWHEISDKPLVE